MRTNINLNVVAETKEEERIEKYLTLLHTSDKVKQFLSRMEQEARRRNVYKYRARIKDVKSAIRTYRINNKKLEEAHDYIEVSFIVDTEDEIYPIVDYLKENLSDVELVDFVSEEMIYSPLVYIKWVPPLGFNLFAHEELIENQMKVPIEIRVCSKEGYISEQAAYYSVQKNDTIKMPIEEKNNLRNLVQHITYKLAILNMRNLNTEEIQKHRKELEKIIHNNKEFLIKNDSLCKEAVLDLGRLIYKCVYDKEISENDDIDDYLKEVFNELLKNKQDNLIDIICMAINQMKAIDYSEIKEIAS